MTRLFRVISIVLVLLAVACSAGDRCAEQSSSQGQVAYEKINIIGETAAYGVYDPSVEYDQDGTGWLAYSAMDRVGYVHTHLARSTDHGKTWHKVKEINLAKQGTFKGTETIEGVWRHETPSLVYDPDDPEANRRWKLFWVYGFAKPPFLGALNVEWGYVLIMYKFAQTPETLPQAEGIALFSANRLPDPYTAKYSLNEIHPSTTNFAFFMEPGAIARNGKLYLSLHAVATRSELFLLVSEDHGESWKFINTLTSYDDAKDLGFDALTAPSIAEENGRLFLSVSPVMRRLVGLTYHGLYILEFDDLSRAQLKRDSGGRLIVHKYLRPLSTKNIGGGQSDYHAQNTYGGIIMAQSEPTAPQERFTILNTKERVVD